jgi:hypothetical protein
VPVETRTPALLLAIVACATSCGKNPVGAAASPSAPEDPPRSEAGFIDVPPEDDGSPHSARMFYVFEAADDDAAKKPIAVFMAGGPGYPSSLELLPYGTARATLESPTEAGVPPVVNPASWTSFANVLFIDERQSGYSFEVGAGSTSASPDGAAACSFAPLGDAADFVRVVLSFLDAHPAIQSAPVVLVGQSYGGERATLILDLLLRYSTDVPPTDTALRATIQAHYDAVFPDQAGTVVAPSLIASQFGRVVLLQPFVLGGLQYTTQDALAPNDPYVGNVPAGHDPYDVRQPMGWSLAIDDTAATALADFDDATKLLAIDPRSVPGMGPAARSGAFRVAAPDTAQAEANAAWTAGLGALEPADQYLVSPATACPYDASLFAGVGSADAFIANLRGGVRTFISDARYDGSIYAPAIPAASAERRRRRGGLCSASGRCTAGLVHRRLCAGRGRRADHRSAIPAVRCKWSLRRARRAAGPPRRRRSLDRRGTLAPSPPSPARARPRGRARVPNAYRAGVGGSGDSEPSEHLVVRHFRRPVDQVIEVPAPLREQGPLTKALHMGVERVPLDPEEKRLRFLDPLVEHAAATPGSALDHRLGRLQPGTERRRPRDSAFGFEKCDFDDHRLSSPSRLSASSANGARSPPRRRLTSDCARGAPARTPPHSHRDRRQSSTAPTAHRAAADEKPRPST